MTTNEAFEKLWCSKNSVTAPSWQKQEAREYYEAATTEANKRIAELDSEVAELKEANSLLVRMNISLAKENSQLKVSNNHLREALSAIRVWCEQPDTDLEDSIGKLACEALSATKKEGC